MLGAMHRWSLIACLLLAACERAGEAQNPLGSGGANEVATGPRAVVDAAVATLPADAAPVVADAAVVVVVDAKPVPPPRRPADDAVRIDPDEMRRFADLLTAEGPATRGVVGDLDSRRQPGADLARQIDDVKSGGRTVVRGGGGGIGARGGGDVRVNGDGEIGGGPKIDGPNGNSEKDVKGPTGRISIASKRGGDTTSLTADVVLAKVQAAYMAGIKRCYRQQLTKDPGARGRVTLAFKVNETGRAIDPRATGFASEVDACVARMMGSWRFPIPKDKDGEPTETGFEIVLALLPD
jgi:hypothetical protein